MDWGRQQQPKHGISSGDICESLRAVVREELAGLRLDICAILRDELGQPVRLPRRRDGRAGPGAHGRASGGPGICPGLWFDSFLITLAARPWGRQRE